jgi:hypothetical protein
MKRILCIALLIAGMSASLPAQNQQQRNDALEVEKLRIQADERARAEAEQRNWETKIYTIRYVDTNELGRALSMFRAQMSANPSLHVLSVRAPKEILPAIEDAIKRLDVPQPDRVTNGELTVFVLMASDQSDPGSNLPASLQPVVAQLKGVLNYRSYQLVETLLARVTNSSRRLNLGGTLQGVRPVASEPVGYTLTADQTTVQNPTGKSPTLYLLNMNFNLGNINIGTNVEIPQGQQVVVGKASMGDRAFILVMSAKFSN